MGCREWRFFLSRVGWFANDFHEWHSHEWKSSANHPIIGESSHEWPKIVIHGKPYVILFLNRFYSIYNTGNWWKLSSNHRLFAMGLSIAVLWRHTSMHCGVILPNCPQNVSMDARAFSRRRQVDYHALIIDRRYHRLACKNYFSS